MEFRSLRRKSPWRRAFWSGIAAGGLTMLTGCQVEYGGMTLPSGKYLYDDVQYFEPGPEFPWANTLAATQRARMIAQGIEPLPAGNAPLVTPGGMPVARPNSAAGGGMNVQAGEPDRIDPAQPRLGPGANAPQPPVPADANLGNSPPPF